MGQHFTRHYTIDEARALLPQIRRWLQQLVELREQMQKSEPRLQNLMDQGGDAGGETVNRWVRAMAQFRGVIAELRGDCNGNYNDCMVFVHVNDKQPPLLASCPRNQRPHN